MIDWSSPDEQVSDHFKVRDCLWLGKWNRLANETDGLTDEIKNDLLVTCDMAEDIRAILGCPMFVTSVWRPSAYSPLVGGKVDDVHVQGLAIDFTTEPNLTIDAAKALLLPHLGTMGIRMEQGTTTWVHCDRRSIGPGGRYFVP